MNFNKVIMAGNLARDPELKYTKNNKAYCKFTLCVNTGWGDKEKTCFVDVIVWEKTAENVTKHLSKGSTLLVDGELVLNQWEKDGRKHSKHEISAFKVVFGGRAAE